MRSTWKDIDRGLKSRRCLGHAVHGAARLVLRDGVMPLVPERSEAHRAVAAHPGQQHADDFARPMVADALEEDIDRGTIGSTRPVRTS